ncbi:hypothetical protein [Anaeromyxobacter terrae]|uniref:hypothetical protein n=1 Tax=Anaeromyxobacter terrae TaxID=2925406 RepID=UPI001F5AB56F|nr:hypothetical protein [Anaeromyxobacter sp. SG22]
MAANPERFVIADGSVHVYRLFDVADAIDLAAAERAVEVAMAAPKSRARLTGAQSATALELPRPPLRVALGAREVPLRFRGARAAETSAHVFDYGVVSILYKLPIAPGAALEDLVVLAEELFVSPTPEIDQAARREAEELCRALGGALERPHRWDGLESYQIFFARRFADGPLRAQELLASAPVAELLLGETSPVRLSTAERQEVLSHHYTYLEDDLAVVHWNSALVVEPSGVEDIPDLLEFATAHLLELRYYDALLDRELHLIYDEIERGGSPVANIFTRRYRGLQRRTAALLLELSEMVERLENAVKIVGDFYLARLYQSAVRRFRLPAWQETVLRKQRLLAEVNDLIGDAADTSRSELLELAIILLIVFEIAAAFR